MLDEYGSILCAITCYCICSPGLACKLGCLDWRNPLAGRYGLVNVNMTYSSGPPIPTGLILM